jgi:hypothetical protein
MVYKYREKKLEYAKKYNQRPEHKKKLKIKTWEKRGLIGDYDIIYDKWLNATNCDICKKKFNKDKCMEHNHQTGEFRSICCYYCNNNMLDNKKVGNNKYKNIYTEKLDKYSYYTYRKTYYGKQYKKRFKTLKEALCYKFIMILKFSQGPFHNTRILQ